MVFLSKKILIILTQKFPFESGEEFLASELKQAESFFDEIILLPTSVRDRTIIRKVGDKVQVVLVSNPQGAFQILFNFLKYFFKAISFIFSEWRKSDFSISAGKYLFYHVPYAIQIKSEVLNLFNDQDSFVCYSYWMDTNAFSLALCKMKNPKVKFQIRTHGGDLYDERNESGRICFRNVVYKSAELVAPISLHGKNYISEKYPEFSQKVIPHRLGVQDSGLGPLESNSTTFRVVSCSSIIPLKRLDKIFSVLSNYPNQIEWIHFGGSQNEIDVLKKSFQIYKDSKLKIIADGAIANQDLMIFYKENFVDLFINLSTTEGIPVSIMEAISFGIPVLSNAVGGIPEIVTPTTGWLVKVDAQIEEIRALLIKVHNSGSTRDPSFRKGVREFWSKEFNAQKNYLTFFDQLEKNQFTIH